ncbi:HNH/ENDO VII family nuclease [Shewanella sp. VB17]|uniref:HNH/ENDO VII family nuclease n=1 Tax=Shewanella sp. VB17 TaxID=2739432 RepID=UPI0028167816|nr:HNH/ENDO VII family nuclease [Shewanella sp. VB17]
MKNPTGWVDPLGLVQCPVECPEVGKGADTTSELKYGKYDVTEVSGRKVYKNTLDVLPDAPTSVHRSVHKSIRQKIEDGWTNLDLMKNGNAPIGPDGKQINLHHILGKEPGPMVELQASTHKKFHKPLHGLIENGRSFRNDPSSLYQYEKFKLNYWKQRAKDFQ